MTEVPPSQDETDEADEADEADELYRRASALDAGRPSEPVRRAILKHAAELATARAAGRKAVKRRPTRQAWWRPAAFGTLAAAALAGLLVMPQFITHEPPDTSVSSPELAEKSAPAAPKVTASPNGTAAQNATAPRNAPLEEVVVTEQRAARTEQRAAKAEQYAAQQGSRRAASKPAAQDELQEQASADAQDKRYGAPAPSQAASDAVVGSAAPPAAPAAALNGVTAGAGAPTAQFGAIAGRASGVMDPAAQLRRAADMGDVPALQALLNKQPAIDARDSGGRSALMLATLRGRAEAVDVLLSAGADPNAADARGTTPLQAALAGNQPAIVEALRRAGAR
jgi:Meckel syndrome type 1 protein